MFVDDAFEKIFDTLGSTLKQFLQKNVRNIDEFAKDAMENMSKKATTIEEVLEFKKKFAEQTKKKFEYEKLCVECEEMNNLLLQLTGQSMNLSVLNNRWDNYEKMLSDFSGMLEEQKNEIKVNQNKKIKQLLNQVDKFNSKFKDAIPPDNYMPDKNTNINELMNGIKKVYEDWDKFDQEFSGIIEEMNNFELQIESDINPYKNMKKEVEKTREKWNLLFEFNDNLDNLSKEEWIGIRHKALV